MNILFKNNCLNTKIKRLTTLCLLTVAVSTSFTTIAKTLAITNATVHTVTDLGVLENATVIITDGLISAINPESFSADEEYDAQGRNLTPGFIGALNPIGLIEVNAVSDSVDVEEEKADITFDTSSAFNPKSTLIPYARQGGVTSNLVIPHGGKGMFRGQAFFANLSGELTSNVVSSKAVVLDLGGKSEGSRSTAIITLINTLEDAQKTLNDKGSTDKDKKDSKKKDFKRDEKIVNQLLEGTLPVVIYADRATDILAAINIKKRFNLNVILVGASDAILIIEQLKAANIPVMIDPKKNLPESFDSLNSSLNNTKILIDTGIKTIIIQEDAHKLNQLRYSVGNAISYGVTKEQALASVTANIADVFKLNRGRIAVGKQADLVLWSADPFELSTKVDKLWIEGEVINLYSRQDALRDRYLSESTMPKAYLK